MADIKTNNNYQQIDWSLAGQGDHRAVQALHNATDEMVQTGVPTNAVELAQIMLALQALMRGQEVSSVAQARYLEQQAQLQARLDAQDAAIRQLMEKLEQEQSHYSPEERLQAKVRLATKVTDATQRARDEAGAKLRQGRAVLQSEPRQEIEWPFEPFKMVLNGLEFHIRQGTNVVPVSVVQNLKYQIKRRMEQEAYKSINSIGPRPNGPRMHSLDQIQYLTKQVEQRFQGGAARHANAKLNDYL